MLRPLPAFGPITCTARAALFSSPPAAMSPTTANKLSSTSMDAVTNRAPPQRLTAHFMAFQRFPIQKFKTLLTRAAAQPLISKYAASLLPALRNFAKIACGFKMLLSSWAPATSP